MDLTGRADRCNMKILLGGRVTGKCILAKGHEGPCEPPEEKQEMQAASSSHDIRGIDREYDPD